MRAHGLVLGVEGLALRVDLGDAGLLERLVEEPQRGLLPSTSAVAIAVALAARPSSRLSRDRADRLRERSTPNLRACSRSARAPLADVVELRDGAQVLVPVSCARSLRRGLERLQDARRRRPSSGAGWSWPPDSLCSSWHVIIESLSQFVHALARRSRGTCGLVDRRIGGQRRNSRRGPAAWR